MFIIGSRLDKRIVSKLTEQLVSLVETHLPPPGDWRHLERAFESELELPEPIQSIIISCLSSSGSSHWHFRDAAYIPELTIEYLQQRIDEKNKSAKSYCPDCGQLWLVLTLDADLLSSNFIVPPEVLAHAYQANFSRVFLSKEDTASIAELKLFWTDRISSL